MKIKVGDMVRAAYVGQGGIPGNYHTGVVVEVNETMGLFSEKYAIVEKNTYISVLCDGNIMTFDLEEDKLEVIEDA